MAKSGSDGSITLFTKIDTAGLKKGFATIKNLGSMAGKAFLAVGVAATTATVAITKMSTSAYADYEQLVGGIETLFKGSADKVLKYAEDAFMTTGMSANQYMENVTSFSARLISSLGGDTEKAAEIANTALVDISDNANKMGSTVESVTTAFQGFAKQQYMLLDNLKLGYGGTKTEMERLLKDAEAYMASQGKAVKYNIDNLGDVYSAIHAIQEKLDIAGTTLKEAEKTITGSANMTKAAWQNVLTAIGGGGDLDKAINNLAYSLTKYFENIVPVVRRSILGIGELIRQITPMLVENVATSLIQAIPSLVTAIYQSVIGVAKGIKEGIKSVFSGKDGVITAQVNNGMEQTAESAEGAAESTEKLADETKKAGKEAKKLLAGFDDLQILADNTSGAGVASAASNIASGGVDVSTQETAGDGQGIADIIGGELATAMVLVGGALVALGVILLCFGQIPLGIGLVVAGITSFGVGAAAINDGALSPTITAVLTGILAVVGTFMVVIGIILICTGVGIPFGIGLILAGIGSMVGAVALNWGSIKQNIDSVLTSISESTGTQIAMTAIGLILLLSGNFIAGLALLGTVYASLKPEQKESILDYIKEKWGEIKSFWDTNIQPSIDSFVSYIKEKYDQYVAPVIEDIKELFKKLWDEYLKKLLTEDLPNAWGKVSDALSKFWEEVGKPALDALGEKMQWIKDEILVPLTEKVLSKIFEWVNDMLPKAFEILKGVLQFFGNVLLGLITIFSDFITGVTLFLTGDWETLWENVKESLKAVVNVMAEFFESFINGAISGFEKMINAIIKGLKKLKVEIPDWIPGVGGKSIGFDFLNEVSFSEIKIPRLAKGAVIPANKEFLAILGDQKHGTNIEAPLQTIVDAFNIALAQNGGNGGNTTVVLEIDGREFGHAVIEQGKRESKRLGTRLVMA